MEVAPLLAEGEAEATHEAEVRTMRGFGLV